MLEQKLEDDIKTAMLAGDSDRVKTLRMLKSALLNKKIAEGSRDAEMKDKDVIDVFAKEAKKRQESADLYSQNGQPERATTELSEKALIDAYLPKQMSTEELAALVDETIRTTGANSARDLGMVIGQVKGQAGAAADGALIAQMVKERLGV
jgi:uncharacterized protein YqeY